MADLTLENADIGFNRAQIPAILEKVHAQVITTAQSKLTTEFSKLRDRINEAWKGMSADKFLKYMEEDKDLVSNGLEDSYNALKAELEVIGKALDRVDIDLVNRGN